MQFSKTPRPSRSTPDLVQPNQLPMLRGRELSLGEAAVRGRRNRKWFSIPQGYPDPLWILAEEPRPLQAEVAQCAVKASGSIWGWTPWAARPPGLRQRPRPWYNLYQWHCPCETEPLGEIFTENPAGSVAAGWFFLHGVPGLRFRLGDPESRRRTESNAQGSGARGKHHENLTVKCEWLKSCRQHPSCSEKWSNFVLSVRKNRLRNFWIMVPNFFPQSWGKKGLYRQ